MHDRAALDEGENTETTGFGRTTNLRDWGDCYAVGVAPLDNSMARSVSCAVVVPEGLRPPFPAGWIERYVVSEGPRCRAECLGRALVQRWTSVEIGAIPGEIASEATAPLAKAAYGLKNQVCVRAGPGVAQMKAFGILSGTLTKLFFAMP